MTITLIAFTCVATFTFILGFFIGMFIAEEWRHYR